MPLPLLSVPSDVEGIFVRRLNRFLAAVALNGTTTDAHIHDPGRLTELLRPGNRVLLRRATATTRKTKWDILAAGADGGWVFVHSGYHRRIAERILADPVLSPFGEASSVLAEVRHGASRLDFLLLRPGGERLWIEVKGCTLAKGGVALFPDAPTARGRRHVEELARIAASGEGAAVLVLVFRADASCFAPNSETDPKFAKALAAAVEKGVLVVPVRIGYDGKNLFFLGAMPNCFEQTA